jgi:hypothetical protein
MKKRFNILFAALMAFAITFLTVPAQAEMPVQATAISTTQALAPLEACPAPGERFNLSQISQADCCKGHKGVCGCRAGKIVCCDNTISPNCTCHADSGMQN